ncbi:LysR family transcriptional regulator [Citrobacter rodentium]|uniref:LysR-family transcriptional regulator n=2 Tax=Citrobacter rodentium TaxID=67825 RepID=D2TPN0_CITRI|nr:LysR family transcriptional regulator [Citrobacter rodentium]KIQ50149.1 transcriptional regulator [Citrobacter rodentium]QBY28625.1 LysR family transcriptional regulator [Citrobacter rodentium]UHO29505.1 LysR family transcriptional regulator [Citrobacter rodentium NBRC 105723 = DSM 16636]CBG88847.1 LysR-family transcriptional regulator [Citrobacter rodentium ICC168]HAT8011912.1 LysR family transcriptional regulator [Citrobacter rodentium NBRC 105723 = DSM 16636]
MDCKWLEDFLALSQHGNYSLAATARHITQPALSRRIKALEEMLGVPLFDRTTTPVTLTRYGERFEPYARQVLSSLTEARQELAAMCPATDDTLVMVSLHTLSVNILPDMINYLRQSEPQLNYTVNASIQGIDNHFNALIDRQIDILVTYDIPSSQPGLDIAGKLKRSLWRYERFIPVISADIAEVLDDPHAQIPWLCYSDYTFVRRIIDPAEQRVRPRLKKVFESGLSETIKEMVMRHMGMAWLPESMVAEALVNREVIHCWPQDAAMICEIPVVIWANIDDQRQVLQRCWEKLIRFN